MNFSKYIVAHNLRHRFSRWGGGGGEGGNYLALLFCKSAYIVYARN